MSAMLVQVENVNFFSSCPVSGRHNPIDLRNRHGSQIEGERVVVYDLNDNKYVWIYKNGRYIEE
jgi:hypothetical protein